MPIRGTPPSVSQDVESGISKTTTAMRRRRFLSAHRGLIIWIVVCWFQAGLLAGWLTMWRFGIFCNTAPTEGNAITDRSNDLVLKEFGNSPPPAAENEVGDLGRGDQRFDEGRYEAAIAAYQPLAEGSGPMCDAVKYRIALCNEELGRWDQAIALYREVGSRTLSARVVAAAQLGQARVWVRMRQPAEAKRLLCDLILRSAEPAQRDQQLIADARYLFALALSAEVLRPEPLSPFNDVVVSHKISEWPVDRLLDWATVAKDKKTAEHAEPERKTPPQETIVVQRVGSSPEEVRVSVSVHQMVVYELLQSLATQSGLRMEWSSEARHKGSVRSAIVNVDHVPLLDLIRALATPLGLVWKIDFGVLRVSGEDETPGEALATYRNGSARRALWEAVLAYPDHLLCPVVLLELGNLDVAAGSLQQAVAGYERLIREHPRSLVLTEAYYNLGLVQTRLDNLPAARNAYFQVVDRTPGNELAPIAYLKIGRLYLDQGDYEHAVSPLRRGLAAATRTSIQPAIALNLAAAYLLTGNPRAANATMVDFRELMSQNPYRDMAAFLDTLAHYRTITDRRQAMREASGLLAALIAGPDDTVLGPVGMLLMGQAYGDLGLVDQMAHCYEKTLAKAKGELAAETAWILADTLNANGRRGAAVKLMESLIAKEQDPWASLALLRLAEISLQENRPQDCLKYCSMGFKNKLKPDQAAQLKLMGRAYEQLGDPRRAARCFSGLAPEP